MTETVGQTQFSSAIALTLSTTPLSNEQINLAIGFQFRASEFPLSEGNIKYGVTGGTLKFHLQDAHFNNISEDIQDHLPITKHPTADHPTCKFALPTGIDILEATGENIPLGILTPTSNNWSLHATLTITKGDLLITEVEGLWRHDLRPNKQAILHRTIALFLIDNHLPSPVISLGINSSTQQTITSSFSPNSNPDSSSLLATIEKIKDSPSDDFLQLCEMANLNPQIDLTGANLRGTTLRGLDLNGANWSRVNLRGADLTDVDLSQGNLQGAKLSGADLSGAYLSNANLKNADLYRASLALANLSGANLQGANLQEANLSQTNLNDCNLEGAKFD